jgi:hypothetical protein
VAKAAEAREEKAGIPAGSFMRSLNELAIRGSVSELSRLLERLDQPLSSGWRRYAEAESRLRELGLPGADTQCFACTSEGRRSSAAVWLQRRGEELNVANVVPLGKRELSDDEYNLILADFDSQVLRPACDGLQIQTELIQKRITLETYLSPEAARRLKAFAATANKSSLHPTDCQRWREFIVQTHVEGADFDPSVLDQWLAEQGWPEDRRRHLVCEYETARSILGTYDEERLEKCLP